MSNRKAIVWVFGVFAVIYMLFTNNYVQAQPSSLPSVYSQGSSDQSKVDSGLTKFFKWGVYFGEGAGAASVLAGVVLSAPIFQKQREGKSMMIGGLFVVLGSMGAHLLVYIAGQLMT